MIFNRDEPTESNQHQAKSAELIVESHARLLRRDLLPDLEDYSRIAIELYLAPFVVLAHDTAADPVFFYANRRAQELFEMTWAQMVTLPSRHSAQPLAQAERQHLLEQVAHEGFIDDYTGVRISATGRRFLIERATVWNLSGPAGNVVGQAATFGHWLPVG